MNPDAMIAKHQLSRKEAGKNWDLNYLLRLSADAAPILTRNLNKCDAAEKERILDRVVNRWTKGTDDWRTSNWSSRQAAQWRAENQELLKDASLQDAEMKRGGE